MVSSVQAVADGAAGSAQIVATLSELKNYYGRQPAIRAAAVRLIAGAGDHDQASQINALARFTRRALRYLCDPFNAEFVQTPDRVLLDIQRQGYAYGDCDDHCLLFASLAEAIGIPCDIVGVSSSGRDDVDHVITIAHLDNGDLEFDLVAKGFAQPAYDRGLFPE